MPDTQLFSLIERRRSVGREKFGEGIATQVAEAASRTATGLESGGAAGGSNALGAGGALANDKEPGVPSGYLNYLVYDERYRLVDQGFVQVSEEAAVEVGRKKQRPPEALALDMDIAQNGFLYAYLSNEPSASSSAVHFDDFTVERQGISIVQHNDFYAFGAVYQQGASRLLSNKYLYQGKELQDRLGLDLYDFHARQYDPLLGRMTSIDPMAAAWDGVSPYAGMANNPISYVDPDGRNPIIIGMMIGGTAGLGIGYASGLRGNELLASTLGGIALGAGVGFGINGGFGGLGQSASGMISQAGSALTSTSGAIVQGLVSSGAGPNIAGFIGQSVLNPGGGWGPATASLGPGGPPTLWQQFAPTPQNWIPGYELVQNYGWNPHNWPTYDGPVVTGAPPILPSTFPVGSIVNYLRNGTRITGALRGNIANAIKNPKLQRVFNDLYRPGANIGSGSAADAIRYTKNTGNLVKGSDHIQKGRDYYRSLKNLIQSGQLDANDMKIANQLIKDLKNALGK